MRRTTSSQIHKGEGGKREQQKTCTSSCTKPWQTTMAQYSQRSMLAAIKGMYANVQCAVDTEEFSSNWFSTNRGVRQGCPLSPLLYILHTADLLDDLQKTGQGVTINHKTHHASKWSALAYVDDIVMAADTMAGLQTLLNTASTWAKRNNMTFNPTKSRVMRFTGGEIYRGQIQKKKSRGKPKQIPTTTPLTLQAFCNNWILLNTGGGVLGGISARGGAPTATPTCESWV